jgi:hypothetical protein
VQGGLQLAAQLVGNHSEAANGLQEVLVCERIADVVDISPEILVVQRGCHALEVGSEVLVMQG